LFWDNTNGRLGIGTSSPTNTLELTKNQNAPTRIIVNNTTTGIFAGSELLLNSNSSSLFAVGKVSSSYTPYKIIGVSDGYLLNVTSGDISILNDYVTGRIKFATNGSSTAQMTIASTGNVLINTTTDAGFKLDVNGTARVQTSIQSPSVVAGATNGFGFALWVGTTARFEGGANFGNVGTIIHSGTEMYFNNISTGPMIFRTNTNVERFRIVPTTGNLLINTTTDAGYKLDVNGTARVQTSVLIGSSSISASAYPLQVVGGAGGSALFSNTTRTQALNINLTTSGETRIYVDYFLTGTDQKFILGTYANRANQLVMNTSGNISIGTTTEVASAQFQIESTTKGFLPPRMTTTQKNAIASPATGLMVYDTTLNLISVYNGTIWISL
jgi:hypothetical protein